MIVSFLFVPTAVEINGVRTRWDPNPRLDFSRDDNHQVQSIPLRDAISPPLVVPHGASLPRLHC